MAEARDPVKTVVLTLTLVMAAMFGVLLWGLMRENAAPVKSSLAPARIAADAVSPWLYTLPQGAMVKAVTAAGADSIAVQIEQRGRGGRVLILNTRTGALVGQIESQP